MSNYKLSGIDEKYGIIRIHLTDIREVFKLSNVIYESDLAEFSLPDFYIEKKLNQVNDPLFPVQFQMNNTGQVVDGIAGVNNIDCNALEAWNMTLGNNVIVAVIDEGLEAHEDLGNRLIGGHTPVNNGNGTPVANNNTHGMNSAGVLAASANNLGLRGVAPNTNLLSVNIFAGGETMGDLADGIRWATDNGADVISNSWGFRFANCGFTDADIDNAIQYAVTSGRSGNGSVVVFAAGNGGGCVEYPASNPNVIAVGAIDNQGNQYAYSARGPQLDLVAPSGNAFGGVGIRTLDRMGLAGDFAGNYRNNFDGTSASCPVVSGAAALVLSVNPNLTQQQVRNILNQTATDMGANGFDNNFGNGRVNACAAVLSAFQTLMTVSGPNVLCSSGSQFSVTNLPAGANVTWTATPSHLFSVSSGSGLTPNLAASTNARGLGNITFSIDSGCGTSVQVQKTIWVGRASVDIIGPYDMPFNTVENYYAEGGYPYASQMGLMGITAYNWSVFPSGYEWIGGQGTSGITLTISNAGDYSLELDVTNPCGIIGTEIPVYVYDPWSMFLIYPNPASDIMTISKKSTLSSKQVDTTPFEISLYDNRGQQLVAPKSGSDQVQLDVSNLKNGFYFVHILYKGKLIKNQVKVER